MDSIKNIPKHVAIIMDGNGRWAKKRGLPRIAGHWAGAETLKDIVSTCSQLNIKILSVFAFSSENWKRPAQEVNTILNLLLYYLKRETDNLHKNNVKIMVIGDWQTLPDRIVQQIRTSIKLTQNNTGLVLNVALNYGSRGEILSACKSIYREVSMGRFDIDKVTEELFKNTCLLETCRIRIF